MSFEDIIKNVLAEQLLEEGITQEDLDLVDLESAFSPVIAVKGETTAVEVTQCIGKDNYIVDHPMITESVDADSLKIMRYRYLMSRNNNSFASKRFNIDNPGDMEACKKAIGKEALDKAFGSGGGGIDEIIDNLNREDF